MWTVPPARSGTRPRRTSIARFRPRRRPVGVLVASAAGSNCNRVDGVRDLLVAFAGRVLVTQRRLRRGVTHPVHEVLEARAGTRREGVGGVAQVVRCQDVRRARTAEAVNGRPRSPTASKLAIWAASAIQRDTLRADPRTDLAARSRRPHLVVCCRADRALVLRGERGELQMADYGVAVSWGEVKPGREEQAFEAWGEAAALNDKAVANGLIERWDAVLFEPVGSPPAGVIRLFGTQTQIDDFIRSEDFRSSIQKAGGALHAVGFRRFMTGEALREALARAAAALEAT